MSVTITFHTLKEKKPAHQESIIWLQKSGSFGFTGYNPRERTVTYDWAEVDEKGQHTGNYCCYDGEEELDGHRLEYYCSGFHLDEDDLWISVDDYWECFERRNK